MVSGLLASEPDNEHMMQSKTEQQNVCAHVCVSGDARKRHNMVAKEFMACRGISKGIPKVKIVNSLVL